MARKLIIHVHKQIHLKNLPEKFNIQWIFAAKFLFLYQNFSISHDHVWKHFFLAITSNWATRKMKLSFGPQQIIVNWFSILLCKNLKCNANPNCNKEHDFSTILKMNCGPIANSHYTICELHFYRSFVVIDTFSNRQKWESLFSVKIWIYLNWSCNFHVTSQMIEIDKPRESKFHAVHACVLKLLHIQYQS